MTVQFFDHYSPQTHLSVRAFLSEDEGWGEKPWNDMNIPVGLSINEPGEEGEERFAVVLVLHPRKSHAKEVTITIEDDAALERLRSTFLGIAESLYGAAASNLERFARGDMPEDGVVLYYWERETVDA